MKYLRARFYAGDFDKINLPHDRIVVTLNGIDVGLTVQEIYGIEYLYVNGMKVLKIIPSATNAFHVSTDKY